jgi:hypothetical protein
MKKLIALCSAFFLTFSGSFVFASTDVKVDVKNNENLSVDAKVKDGTTYIPLAQLGKIFNADVDWDKETNTVMVNTEGFSEVNDQTNDDQLSFAFNGEAFYDFDFKVWNEEIYVPLQKVAELMGAEVTWNANTNTVMVVKNTSVALSNEANNNDSDIINIIVDGQYKEIEDVKIIENHTYVPVRDLADMLGAEVEYKSETHSLTLSTDQSILPEQEKEIDIIVKGETVTEFNTYLIDGETYVPVKEVSNLVGANVMWDGDMNAVKISTHLER